MHLSRLLRSTANAYKDRPELLKETTVPAPDRATAAAKKGIDNLVLHHHERSEMQPIHGHHVGPNGR